MDIGKYIKDSWEIYSKNFVELLIAALITLVLSVITIGILAPCMITGLAMLFVKAKRGQAIANKEVFAYISKWYLFAVAAFIIGILTGLGLICLIVPGLILGSWWMYTFLFMADKNLGIGEAMKASKDLVRAKGVWMHLLLLIIYSAIGSLGQAAWTIGAILTWPFAWGIWASAYVDETK